MRRFRIPLILATVIALMSGALLLGRAPSSAPPVNEAEPQPSPQAKQISATTLGPQTKLPQLVTAPPAEAPKAATSFTRDSELREYQTLKAKVLLTPAEKSRRANLIRDAEFLRSLSPLLLRSAARSDLNASSQQDTALDLLFEALENGDRTVAEGVLAEAVQNPLIEGTEMALDERKQLAGIKAEILYQWVSTAPEAAARIAALLPGPVSRKLWDNVIETQRRNLAESRTLSQDRK